MNRKEFLEDLPILFDLRSGSGHFEYKEGSPDDPGDSYDKIIAVGWAKITDQGGPWKRVEVTPEGDAMIERLFQAAGLVL
jgi:hypothetical protein